jgi:hypothetical protein
MGAKNVTEYNHRFNIRSTPVFSNESDAGVAGYFALKMLLNSDATRNLEVGQFDFIGRSDILARYAQRAEQVCPTE